MTINTLYELVRNSVEKFASKVAFSMFEGDDVTYAEVGRRIEKVQEILTGAGLRAGDKVALLSSNMPNWSVCYFAIVTSGFWLGQMLARKPRMLVAVALANKTARIIWALLAKGGVYKAPALAA